jgi:hypothetical protein
VEDSSWNADAKITVGIRNCTFRMICHILTFLQTVMCFWKDSMHYQMRLSYGKNRETKKRILNVDLIKKMVSNLILPCRVVVSGPSAFNSAVRLMLLESKLDEDYITILEA